VIVNIIHHFPNPQEQGCRQRGARWCTSTSVHSPLVMNILTTQKEVSNWYPNAGLVGKNAIIRETSLPDNTAEHIITTYHSTEIQKSNDKNSLVFFFSYLAYRKKCYHGKDSFLLGYDKDNRIPTFRGKVVSSSSRFRSRS